MEEAASSSIAGTSVVPVVAVVAVGASSSAADTGSEMRERSTSSSHSLNQRRVGFDQNSPSLIPDLDKDDAGIRDGKKGGEEEQEENESRRHELEGTGIEKEIRGKTAAAGSSDNGPLSGADVRYRNRKDAQENADQFYDEKERKQDAKVIRKLLQQSTKNRPKDSDWRQQRLQAWEPMLTASTVLPSFLVIGILFIPIGILLLKSSNDVQEFRLDYTDCNVTQQNECIIGFELKEDFVQDVYLQYELQNYHQSHRHYASSRDDSIQMSGRTDMDPAKACEPFRFDDEGRPIAPCGIVANSMFNDTFEILVNEDNDNDDDVSANRLHHDSSDANSGHYEIKNNNKSNNSDDNSQYNSVTSDYSLTRAKSVKINRTNIAWVTDKAYKYANPDNMSIFETEWSKPINWNVPANRLDPENSENNGFLNEHFLVWIRIAAFPTFRKFYGRVFSDRGTEPNVDEEGKVQHFEEGLPAGNYTLRITYNYPVKEFAGRKIFILTTTSWFGGKSNFLGISYIVTGSLILVLTLFLFLVDRKYARETY